VAPFVFNMGKGRVSADARLPLANDALVAVLLQSAGLETDAVLLDKDTMTDVVSGATDEATFAGYARQVLTGVVVTVDDVNNRVDIDCNDPTWSPTAGQALGKIAIFYDPDTTGGTDADLIPEVADDFVLTTPPTGTVSYAVAGAGFFRAS
jgi:hypothetical protein